MLTNTIKNSGKYINGYPKVLDISESTYKMPIIKKQKFEAF